MKTAEKLTLTNQSLVYWQEWYKQKFVDRLMPLDTLEKTGTYWVYGAKGKRIEFDDLHIYPFKQEEVAKISKLKIGTRYRKDIQGWIVPDDLAEEFKKCCEVSEMYASLRRDAISAISKAHWNGYERVKRLSPEKMQMLIDTFADNED